MASDVDRRVVRIRRASTVGVVLLAGGGFAMSYGALHGLALAEGVDPALAWMWPLIVDGFIVVASLAVLHAVLERRSTLYPWCLVLGFSAISVAFNVLHAAPTPVARLVGAVPPLALVLSLELLMRQTRAALEQPARGKPASPARPSLEVVRPSGDIAANASALIRQHRQAGRRLTGSMLARELGVSDSYGRRLLRELAVEGASVP